MILGLDPGLHGAVAVVTMDGLRVALVDDLPLLKVGTSTKGTRQEFDMPALRDLLARASVLATVAFVERVGAMPKQGLSSTFRFGYSAGTLHGLLASMDLPLEFVRPQAWQAGIRIQGQGKDAARARAQELFPLQARFFARVKDEHRADAALIAAFGARTMRGRH